MKNISALVAALLLMIGLSTGTAMAEEQEMSDEGITLEQSIVDGEEE